MTKPGWDKTPSKDFEEYIQELEHPDPSVRRHAAIALGDLGDPRALDPLIKTLQEDKEVFGAAPYAADALGRIGDPRAVEPLIAALEIPMVVPAAIKALSELGDARMVEPLICMLQEQHEHASTIATVLGNYGDPRAVDPLMDSLRNGTSSLRFYSARALGKLGDPRALPALERAVEKDTKPLTNSKSFKGKSVSDVAADAVQRIMKVNL